MQIRPLRPDDAEAVVALYASCMTTEPGIGPITAAGWADTIRLPQFGGGRDFIVATERSGLVASAESSLRTGGAHPTRMVKILVDPGRRRDGIATALLRAVLAQGPDDPALVIDAVARADWPAGLAVLQRWGFEQTEAEIAMHCEALTPSPESPRGLAVDPVADSEVDPLLETIADIHNRAYRDDAGFLVQNADDRRAARPRSASMDASGSRNAVARGAIRRNAPISRSD